MKTTTTIRTLLLSTCLVLPFSIQAETVRDCVLEGTVKKQRSEEGKVYVAFHSAKAAEAGAKCRMKQSEKLHFKQPASSKLDDVKPGSRVEYRYTEDSEDGASWELQNVSS